MANLDALSCQLAPRPLSGVRRPAQVLLDLTTTWSLGFGLRLLHSDKPIASPLAVPGRHRLREAHWPANLGSQLGPEIHGSSCPSEAPSNPPQHSRIGSGLQFGVEVEEVGCRIGRDGRHVPGR